MSGKLSRISVLVPLALLCIVVAMDFSSYEAAVSSGVVIPEREALILAMLLLFTAISRQYARRSEQSVVEVLQHVFFLSIIIFALIYILTLPRILNLDTFIQDRSVIAPSRQSYLRSLFDAIVIGLFAILALSYLRILVYLKRKRYTARNFRLLVLILFVTAYYRSFGEYLTLGTIAEKIIEPALLYLFILLIVVNSLRVSWINYLNKRQKIVGFWGGLVVVPSVILIALKLHNTPSDEIIFSKTLSAFSNLVALFFAIYVITAYAALLLHLPTAAIFDRKIRQIASLRDLSRTVSSVFDFDELVDTITRLTLQATDSNFSWLLLSDEAGKDFHLSSARNLTSKERKNMPCDSNDVIIKRILDEEEPFIVNEASKHSPLKEVRRWKRDIGSILAVPLISSEQIKGVLCAAKREEYSFEQEDRDMLMAFADQAVVALENARLIKESILKERFEEELKIAHDAQMKLLPKVMPRVSRLTIDATCITANEVGGDYYDFFELDDDKLGMVIADVSGKGPSAAFYMAEIKGIIESLAQAYSSPKDLLSQVNRTLYDNIDRKTFITMIYAIFDPKQRKLTFCRAGHCPPILCQSRNEEFQMLEPGGLGLGLDNGPLFDITIKEQTVRLRKGDTVLLYTDGVTEARNTDEEEFSEIRLGETMVELHTLPATDIREQLVAHINTFVGEQQKHDDLTFVVMQVV
jgi:sigma-B regulation protein RsbU (phosphoserine phosphatase)